MGAPMRLNSNKTTAADLTGWSPSEESTPWNE
jgi:hypothetical protein